MPPKLHPLAKASYVMGICTALTVLMTTVFMWVSGIAFASDVEKVAASQSQLEVKHDKDIVNLEVKLMVFAYQKDIDELTLKPNKSQHDKNKIQLWQHKITQLR